MEECTYRPLDSAWDEALRDAQFPQEPHRRPSNALLVIDRSRANRRLHRSRDTHEVHAGLRSQGELCQDIEPRSFCQRFQSIL